MKMNPYLTFDGNCHEAMTFYAEALGGVIEEEMRFGDMPPEAHFPDMDPDRMAHMRIRIGDQHLMASDSGGQPHSGFHGHSIQTAWESPDEAGAAFARLSAGGEVRMPIGPTFWARAFGMCVDRFGVAWMVNCD